MSEIRVIRKYPNRRLYDSVESRYVTLRHVRTLIARNIDIAIIDQTTRADITSQVLLQVLVESQQEGQEVLSKGFMLNRIKELATSAAPSGGTASDALPANC